MVAAFQAPNLDYLALGPEIVLTATLVVAILVDLALEDRSKVWVTRLTGLGILLSTLPIFYMADKGITGEARVMFGGAYVTDTFSLVLKALLLISGFVVFLLSFDYIGEGDYYEGEFAYMVLSSLLGMVVMASARDLVTIFVALELLSIPGYLLAGWRKRDARSNEASLKYYLLGVLASSLMLYGMSLIYGFTGSLVLSDIGAKLSGPAGDKPIVAVAIFLVIVGFAFKISAVPFHLWAPDTYEGAPTPVTAFLSVASKTAGFIALLELTFIAFVGRGDVTRPIFWVLAALTMTIGNLTALRQTNIVRLLAYSSVAQAGFILVPFAVATERSQEYIGAVVVYLLLYAAMNLGAFAIVIAVARRTRSGEITSYRGLFSYAPGLATAFSAFLLSLAGIPFLAGWYAKFAVIRSLFVDLTLASALLGIVVAVNTAIAAAYYLQVIREMCFRPAEEGVDVRPVAVPAALITALGITLSATIILGFIPGVVARLGNLSTLFPG
ncbi:MAG: NADH-quinone oxidoreductase subunit N [Acidimicrobiales bacterium]